MHTHRWGQMGQVVARARSACGRIKKKRKLIRKGKKKKRKKTRTVHEEGRGEDAGEDAGMGALRVQQAAKAQRVCMGCRRGGDGDGGTPGQGGRACRRRLHVHSGAGRACKGGQGRGGGGGMAGRGRDGHGEAGVGKATTCNEKGGSHLAPPKKKEKYIPCK